MFIIYKHVAKQNMQRAATLDKSLDILEAIREAREEGLGIREMARRLDINPTTVHNLAWTLCERGYLQQDGRTKRFLLGPACRKLAQGDAPFRDLAQRAEPLVRRCQDELGETVMLAALHGREIAPLVYLPSSQSLRVHEPNVMAEHAYGTAVGKILLSTLGEADLEAYLRAYPPYPFTATTAATPRAVRAALREVRRQGYAGTHDELTAGVSALAVLIEQEVRPQCTAALAASAPTVRLDARQARKTLETLRHYARLIGRAWK
jgi:IclR family transcriptional regulator, KDG regulon repressor